jgi:uncharacterized OB-fold protein
MARDSAPPPEPGVLPTPVPHPNLETQEFWDATARGELLLKRCDACGYVIWYPRSLCPACGGTATSWFPASGKGTVYSCTVTRKGQGAYRNAGPFVLAYVELEEGPRLMTNIVECDPGSVHIGQAVEVVFHDTGQGSALPRFRPA